MERSFKVSTKQQLDRLVDLVKKNPNVGRGKRLYGSRREELKNAWQKFAVELNSLGPPSRTAPEWQRVWIHYKANLKRKLARNKDNLLASVSGAFHEISLSATEEKAYELTKPHLSLNPTECVHMRAEQNETPPSTTESPLINDNTENADQSTAKRRFKRVEAQMLLLEEMVAKQNQMLRTLRKMHSTQHKLYQLKLEKLKFMKKHERAVCALRNLKIKLTKEKLKRNNN